MSFEKIKSALEEPDKQDISSSKVDENGVGKVLIELNKSLFQFTGITRFKRDKQNETEKDS